MDDIRTILLLLNEDGWLMIDAFTEASRGVKERRELDQWDSRATEKLRSRAAKGFATRPPLSSSTFSSFSPINLRFWRGPFALFVTACDPHEFARKT